MSKWVSDQLGNIAFLEIGGTPSREIQGYWATKNEDGEPWVSIADLKSRIIYKTKEKITILGVVSSNVKLVKSGTLIMSFKLSIGRAAIAGINLYTNEAIAAITPKNGIIDSTYLYYILPSVAKNAITDTAVKGATLNKQSLNKLSLSFPSQVNYQQKIATILQTIDQTIEKTEALIAKYQKIKAGLMHDLFTRGITADGKLRPPREQAPELYQETPIGWIPKDWDFTSCIRVCEKIIDCKNRTPPIAPDGYPVIRTPNVRNGLFVDNELVFTNFNSYLVWTARGKPKINDIVITREAPVGEVCKIPKKHPSACLGQRMMLYRTNPEKIDNDYFLYALQSQAIQNRLDLISGGSTVGHVRVGDIRELWIYLPKSRIEQLKIAEGLNKVAARIEKETMTLKKLAKKKRGLMQDLLTGKVPVKIDQLEAENA